MQYLIDASVYIFRAYYSMPEDMVDDNGNPVNALYGFCRFIGDFMEQVTPEYIAVLFDESMTESYRTEIYPEYKANRDPAPPELKRQFGQCRRFVKALGLMEHSSPAYEADDLIGTLVHHGREKGRPSTIVTRDKDLTQVMRRSRIRLVSGRSKSRIFSRWRVMLSTTSRVYRVWARKQRPACWNTLAASTKSMPTSTGFTK